MDKFTLQSSYKKSQENFDSTSKIFEDGLEPQLLIDLFEYLIPTKPEAKITELHLHFSTIAQQLVFDFVKAAITLCEGHLGDHYFYKRRSVEYIQLYAFIASSNNPKELFQEYLSSESTADFKTKNKFKKWFSQEKTTMRSKFPNLIKAYDNACKYGTHAGIPNQIITQHWKEAENGLFAMINYFDLASEGFEKNLFEPTMIQLFHTYNDIFAAIFWYKLTSYPFPQAQYSEFARKLQLFREQYKAKLLKTDPQFVERIMQRAEKEFSEDKVIK